jgi:ribonuclease HII
MKYQPKLQFEDKYNIKNKTISEINELIKNIKIDKDLIDALYADKRKTTSKIAVKCEKIFKENKILKEKLSEYKNIENQIYNKGYENIYGFYVTGINAAAGPLTFCLIKLNRYTKIIGIKYSDELTSNQRNKFFNKIQDKADYIDIIHINSNEIDKNGLKNSIITGYKILKNNLVNKVEIDKEKDFFIYYKYGINSDKFKIVKSINKKVYILAASSIVAKKYREKKMQEISKNYPEYNFDKNHGYITKKHRKIVRKRGFCPVHRKKVDFEKKLKFEF